MRSIFGKAHVPFLYCQSVDQGDKVKEARESSYLLRLYFSMYFNDFYLFDLNRLKVFVVLLKRGKIFEVTVSHFGTLEGFGLRCSFLKHSGDRRKHLRSENLLRYKSNIFLRPQRLQEILAL